MNIDIDLNNKILIIPNNIKTKVVKNINNLPKLSNVKILTDQEFITNLTIDYNEKAIIYLMNNKNLSYQNAKEILKNTNLYENFVSFTSCPTCGRTQVDLIPIAKEIEDFCSTLPYSLKVAVMGCAVNGPGEAKEADIGIAGGNNEWLLFKRGKIIKKIPHSNIITEFKKEILNMTKE